MGSYAECWLGNLHVASTKGDVDPSLMQLFRQSDKRVMSGSDPALPDRLRAWTAVGHEDLTFVFYIAPVAVTRDRLELLGYTFETAKAALALSLKDDLENCVKRRARASSLMSEFYAAEEACLRELSVERWLAELRQIDEEELTANSQDRTTTVTSVLDYILREDWSAYTGPDPSVGLGIDPNRWTD